MDIIKNICYAQIFIAGLILTNSGTESKKYEEHFGKFLKDENSVNYEILSEIEQKNEEF